MVVKFILIFGGLYVPKGGVECKSLTVIDSLFVYENKYYLQAYLDDYAYKTVNTEIVDYLDYNLSETD